MEKVVTFGGPIYECLTLYDKGDTKPFEVIIEQLSDTESDYRQMNKLILEVGSLEIFLSNNRNFQIKKCAPLIAKRHVKMLRCLLGMSWGDFPDSMLTSWLTTVQAVVTSDPVHLRPALSILINTFRGG